MTIKERMEKIAREMRSAAKWDCNMGYYATEAEATAATAKEAVYINLANAIDNAFDLDTK
jgi:hypothetical protein